MDITLIWLAVGLGCIWHGAQIVWVAPLPSQFRKDQFHKEEKLPPGSPQAFQRFWIDQYGLLGITLVASGLVLAVYGTVSGVSR